MEYVEAFLNVFFIYLILSLSANALLGFGGIFTLFQAGIFGIGAYVYAFFSVKAELPFILSSLFAILISSITALIFSISSLRIKKDYVVLSTIAFQIILSKLFYSLENITGGPYGITGIPEPSLGNFKIDEPFEYLIFNASVALIITLLISRVFSVPFGISVKGFREDEVLLSSYGVSPELIKLKLFTFSGTLAGVAGVLYASYVGFIDPTSFTLMESVFIVSTVLVGGSGSVLGSIVGTFILVGIPELLRYIPDAGEYVFFVRQILFSTLIILILYFRPKGLVGDYAPR
ncbi:MAG TPA: branched-chain amino acid ABC transporter permease [Aquifex aeolicus]|nr:branched-chain amino acid ABC transporter permease [Aquifex aeolicus]